jgi:Eukaryotic membrane protein family
VHRVNPWIQASTVIIFVCDWFSWKSAGEVLNPAEICDLLKGIILIVCCVLMNLIDVSMMYHVIRGQTVIKLYIFFNMLDVSCIMCCLLTNLWCCYATSSTASYWTGDHQ